MYGEPMILVRKCEECKHEWEVEWDGLTTPVANGHMPDEWDRTSWSWSIYHGANDCMSPLIVDRQDFDKFED